MRETCETTYYTKKDTVICQLCIQLYIYTNNPRCVSEHTIYTITPKAISHNILYIIIIYKPSNSHVFLLSQTNHFNSALHIVHYFNFNKTMSQIECDLLLRSVRSLSMSPHFLHNLSPIHKGKIQFPIFPYFLFLFLLLFFIITKSRVLF